MARRLVAESASSEAPAQSRSGPGTWTVIVGALVMVCVPFMCSEFMLKQAAVKYFVVFPEHDVRLTPSWMSLIVTARIQ